ncbi:lysozyme-like protein [Piromyces finnis]|uniref:Lysozyme-like protein n=1 Tax=Piromyces finnis TaxID=1754191 RepID=A0A1Y1VE89_9FUNG|nr:lysozyme-like protein [Piromyces finnis]|eukprot:ORX53286.1 lysozyme-like protein [Piromyces finnis]
MRLRSKVIYFLNIFSTILILPLVIAVENQKCYVESVGTGVCVNEDQCIIYKGQEGNATKYPGYCKNDSEKIKCCIKYVKKLSDGTTLPSTGKCKNINEDDCSEKSYTRYRDQCPGKSVVQLCVPNTNLNNDQLKVSDNIINIIKGFEGCILTAYKDSVGKWTIGYGTTNDNYDITGTYIKEGLTIDEKTAEEWLKLSIEKKYGPMVKFFNYKYNWNQNEYDALCSFAYNVGSIDELTNNGQRTKEEINKKILEYYKGRVNGVLVPFPGLVRRRAAEAALFAGCDYSTYTNFKKKYTKVGKEICDNIGIFYINKLCEFNYNASISKVSISNTPIISNNTDITNIYNDINIVDSESCGYYIIDNQLNEEQEDSNGTVNFKYISLTNVFITLMLVMFWQINIVY